MINLKSAFDLPIGQILNININPRQSGIEEDHVTSIDHASLDAIPPIVVFPYKNGYVIVDGYHRYTSFKRRNIGTIKAQECELPQGFDDTAEALKAVAYESNLTHGKPLNKSERTEYAYLLYRSNPSISMVELSKRVGVSDKTVKAYILQQMQGSEDTEEQAIVERHACEAKPVNHAKRVLTAIKGLFENERVLLGKVDGGRSEVLRAQLLLKNISEYSDDDVRMCKSLARTLDIVASTLEKQN